jgi:hypothetical protein
MESPSPTRSPCLDSSNNPAELSEHVLDPETNPPAKTKLEQEVRWFSTLGRTGIAASEPTGIEVIAFQVVIYSFRNYHILL